MRNMEKASCENVLQAGIRKGESCPPATAGGRPPYSAVGDNCLVGRRRADLRKHDPSIPIPDDDLLNLELLRTSTEEEDSDCSLKTATSGRSRASLAASRKRAPQIESGSSDGGRPTAKTTRTQDACFKAPLDLPKMTRAKATLPRVDDLVKEMAEQPTGDLGSRLTESLATVESVADRSKNLKGEFVRALRLSVRHIQAIATELVQRSSPSHLEQENALLRNQLAEMRAQIEALTKEVSQLRQQNKEGHIAHLSGDDPKADEGHLMSRLGAMIDRKLNALKTELFPDRALRPPLGRKTVPVNKTPAQLPEPSWSEVTRHKDKAKRVSTQMEPVQKQKKGAHQKAQTAQTKTPRPPKGNKKKRKKKVKLPKVPKTAAVTVTVPEEATMTYAQAMAMAKQKVNLTELGISGLKQKKALNGGLLLEVEGEQCADKANALASKLQEALFETGVRITRPHKTGEIRVMDLDDSVTEKDVTEAIAEAGGCSVDTVKVGQIHRWSTRLGTAWVRCPLMAVHRLAEEKRVKVGWVVARVQVLSARPLQCFRCLETGHTRYQCTSTKDRSTLCYICGDPGHKARECQAKAPKCVLCADRGQNSDHRLGSRKCFPPNTRRGRRGDERSTSGARAKRVDRPAQPSVCASSYHAFEETMEIGHG